MTIHTHDTNPQDGTIEVATVKKKPAKKSKARAKAKTQLTKVVNQKPIVDLIEDALTNPEKQPERQRGPDGKLIKVQSEPAGEELTRRQKRFCQLYTGDGSFFGNGVQAYLEVYDIDTTKTGWYKTACVCASQTLSIPKVTTYINQLLEESGLNKEFMDKQLLFLATQHMDFGNKLGAIKEYNRITKRVDDSPKVEVTVLNEEKMKRLNEMYDRLALTSP